MNESIQCVSCGSINQLPTGKTSMFCAFCGNSIIKVEALSNKSTEIESSLKVKPEISQRKTKNERVARYDEYIGHSKFVTEETVVHDGGELSLINRNINSLQDIIYWFSDNELNEIRILNLANNNIKSLDGINRFRSLEWLSLWGNKITSIDVPSVNTDCHVSIKNIVLSNNQITSLKGIKFFNCSELDISNNQIEILDELPSGLWSINLNDNPNLTSFSEDIKNRICRMQSFTLDISGCSKFNNSNIVEIINRNKRISFSVNIGKGNALPKELLNIGFEKNKRNKHLYDYYTYPGFTELKHTKNSNCFIATATLGSYDHPMVVELRHFRDNWILKKNWGAGFVKLYYHYGALAAKKIEKSAVLKKICFFLIVKPLVYIARTLRATVREI